MCAGATFAGHHMALMLRDGTLQSLVGRLIGKCSAALLEHLIEPVTNLSGELFETIRRNKENSIVTLEELAQSKRALSRMLDDFLKSHKASVNLLSEGSTDGKPTPDEVMEALMRSYEQDMKNPIAGLVFGGLMTSMLIQVKF